MGAFVVVRNVSIAFGIVVSILALLGLVPQGMPWRRIAKSSALAAALAQTGIGSVGVLRGGRTPAAIVFPLCAVFVLAGWLLFPSARFLGMFAPAIDVGLIIFLIGLALSRTPRKHETFEDRLQGILDRWLPRGSNAILARIAAFDFGGFVFVLGGWRKPAPRGIPYHRANSLIPIVWIVVFAALPELFIVELFLANKPFWWHGIDAIVHVYAMFWFIALYASFRERPHIIVDEKLVVRRGLFDSMHIPLDAIDQIELAKPLSRVERRLLGKDTAYLGVLDAQLVKVSLRRPMVYDSSFRASRHVARVFFAADDPAGAVRLIAATLALANNPTAAGSRG